MNNQEPWTLYVGTYTDGSSNGIYTLRFNADTGVLDSLELKAELPNPSFLALSKDKAYLYAVQETADYDSLGGAVTAFAIDSGQLKRLNTKGSGGAHPCHVAVGDHGQLAVSNYTGGNLAIFELLKDGSLGRRQMQQHTSLDSLTQPHVHMAAFGPDGGLLTADLGLDAIKMYSIKDGEWLPEENGSIALPKGAGPRHFVHSADRKSLYVINELNATIAVFEKKGATYTEMQTMNTLAEDWGGVKSCADIHLSPDGKFLYGSNRGENLIVVFSVDETSGKLTLVGRESVRGDWPRNFTMTPDGAYLLVANQKSNNITVFKRDGATGMLKYTSQFEVGAPVCLVFP